QRGARARSLCQRFAGRPEDRAASPAPHPRASNLRGGARSGRSVEILDPRLAVRQLRLEPPREAGAAAKPRSAEADRPVTLSLRRRRMKRTEILPLLRPG